MVWLWPSLRAWLQCGTPCSDGARQIAIPRVPDEPRRDLVAKYEHDRAVELRTACRFRRYLGTASSRQRIPQPNTCEFNAVVLGAADVGKSALVLRFMKDDFVGGYDPSIQGKPATPQTLRDYCTVSTQAESYRRYVTVDDETSVLEVLDTAGTEQFTALNEFYIKAGRGFILVFSLTQRDGLREVQNLREQIYRVKKTMRVPIVIVGTNADLTEERQVQREALMQLSAMWESPVYETSAKKNWHVRDPFEDLVRQMRLRDPIVPRRSRPRKKRHPRLNDGVRAGAQ